MLTGIHHVALKVRDFERAVKFYRDDMGLRFVRAWGDATKQAAMLDTGAGIVEIFSNGPDDAPEGYFVHLALSSDNVDADYQKAIVAGAKPHKEPADYHIAVSAGTQMDVRIAFVISPTGETVEFIKHI